MATKIHLEYVRPHRVNPGERRSNMAIDPKDIDEVVGKVVASLAPMLGLRIPVISGGFQCTGSRFACGQYKCGTGTPSHSCRDVFECNITFTEPKLQF